MKRYLKYSLKKFLPMFAVVAVVMLIAYVIPIEVKDYSINNNLVAQGQMGHVETYIPNILVVFGAACAIAPFYALAYKMTPRSVDMYYSLPITRTKLFAVQFLAGFGCVFAAYTAGYWLGSVAGMIRIRGLAYIWYLWIYLASILPAFCIYAITSFMMVRSNSPADAVICAILAYFAPTILVGALNRFARLAIAPEFLITFSPLSAVGNLNNMLVKRGSLIQPRATLGDIFEILSYCITFLLAAGATAAMFLTEKNCKAENCGQITESIFCYKLLLPIYYLGLCTWIVPLMEMWALCIFAFCAFMLTALWRRTVKIGKKYLLLLIIYTAAAVALCIVVNMVNPAIY